MNKKELKQQEARETLLKNYIKPTDTIGICIKSVSNSGMARRMRVYTSDFSDITYYIADLIQNPINNTGILVKGCGMDMTFWLANYITIQLWPSKKPKSLKGNGGGSCRCLNWRVL